MQVHFHGRDHNLSIQCEEGTSLRTALATARILASTVIVSHEGVVLPHATLLTSDVKLLVTTVSSGG
jgi:sulfur carrier protein ThiS|tara:strand:+ start:569 stop:769 length:201 start_codon:yes stop_codon:yes gene_type:complete